MRLGGLWKTVHKVSGIAAMVLLPGEEIYLHPQQGEEGFSLHQPVLPAAALGSRRCSQGCTLCGEGAEGMWKGASVQGQAGWDLEQLGPVDGVPSHGRRVEQEELKVPSITHITLGAVSWARHSFSNTF